ncbi:DNA repair protein rad52 [Coemansia sp. RSA 2050]|nr:DNA repair protein rad52 [Coemansia sp. RSA 2050]KAJ2735737.1 DNA repair protein rad52 [Coemansia sp. BCRC 34962]
MTKSDSMYVGGHDDDTRAAPYSKKEARRIQSQLRRPLGPEHVSKRAGVGNTSLSYIEGWRIINIANQIFGFDGWSSSIQNFSVDYDDQMDGRWNLGCSCLVRITLRDGTYKEDIGYGTIDNAKSRGMAYEKCKKEAVTDAIKRAMRQFGNSLGNCVYDKEYVRTVAHIQKQPRNRLQGEDLFRYSDMVSEANCANLQLASDGDNSGAGTSGAARPGGLSSIVAQDLGGQKDDHGAESVESVDFDMDDLDDDAFDGLGYMETDRPVIPESPSCSYDIRLAQHSNQPVQSTPARVATSGPGWRPSSAPGVLNNVRPGASPGEQAPMVQGLPNAARNLFCPSHPPRPAAPAQQVGGTTSTFRRPSFAETSGFTPSSQVALALGSRPPSASKTTSVPNGNQPNS